MVYTEEILSMCTEDVLSLVDKQSTEVIYFIQD